MKHGYQTLIVLAGLTGLAAQFGCGRDDFRTEIVKWQDGKAAAVSLTYDDNSANQFRVAVPLMRRFDFPATFHVI
ncbi:MAG: hypothetical protein ACXWH4_12115, partial [Candidatus Aminicenantales bacterium]